MPRKESLSNGSQDLPAADFASRLRDVMDQSGLSSNDVARRVRAKLPKGDSFAASNLSHYRRGRSVPRAKYLIALSSVLGVKPADLLPGGENDDAAGDNGTAPASRRTPSRRKRTRQRGASIPRGRGTRRRGYDPYSGNRRPWRARAIPIRSTRYLGSRTFDFEDFRRTLMRRLELFFCQPSRAWREGRSSGRLTHGWVQRASGERRNSARRASRSRTRLHR